MTPAPHGPQEPPPATEPATRRDTRHSPSFLSMVLAAMLGALIACAVLGIAGVLYVQHQIDHVDATVADYYQKAFTVTTDGDDGENAVNEDAWCRNYFETQNPDETYEAFKKAEC
jgi:uncharacterized protein HemX